MNALVVFMFLSVSQICHNHFTEAKKDRGKIQQNKNFRVVEPFTTIFIDNESFSIVSKPKHPIMKSNIMTIGRKEHFKGFGKVNREKMNHEKMSHKKMNHEEIKHQTSIKGLIRNVSENAKIKPHHAAKATESNYVANKDKVMAKQHKELNRNHMKNSISQKKKLYKRQFEQHYKYYKANGVKRKEIAKYFAPTYRVDITKSAEGPKNSFETIQTKNFLTTAKIFGETFSVNKRSEIFKDLNVNTLEDAKHFTTAEHPRNARRYKPFFSSLTPTWLDPSNSKEDSLSSFSEDNINSENSRFYQSMATIPYRNDDPLTMRSVESWMTTTTPPKHSMIFHQADIIERNLAAASSEQTQMKYNKDSLPGDETDFDDSVVTFARSCDQIVNQICSVQREVGDVLTLAVEINSSRKLSSFQIRWMKVYHKFDSNKGKFLEIEAAKLPWNMVSGSEGRELRLNPVTNSDTDPNCFIADVYLITKNRGKMLFTQLKKLVFRIEMPIIDMGKLYAGEELSINIENFISIPEKGNLLLQWNLETKPQEYQSLPSNIKASGTGRVVVIKELKKGRLGVLNCVIYSSTRYAVAKRRFNILRVFEDVKRRSTETNLEDEPSSHDLLRRRRCRHVIRRSQEEARQRMKDGNKPISRKKRYRRMESLGSRPLEIDCELLRKKMYSRLVRSLFRELTTEDSRLMPLERLFELSEAGDGTLDDVIPHEVHYVSPKVKLISGTAAERSVDHSVSTNCTSHFDCGENAVCVFSEELTNFTGHTGNCYCRPEFYRDGSTCRKIPSSSHREKRLKRNARNDFTVHQRMFYANEKSTPETLEADEDTEQPKVLAFEEEESFLLTDCIDDKDCSMHANCVQPTNGHPYCKCRAGFRGNGIFCWETMDYVPSEEQSMNDEDMDQPPHPVIPLERMEVETAETIEVEEDD